MSFQEFEPRFDWVHHHDSHVLVVHIPGFRTNELKVQVTSTGKLRLAGERKPATGKWLRFLREFEVPADADTDKISAKFEDGVLYIRHPKKTIPSNLHDHQTTPKEEAINTSEKPTAAGAQQGRENASKNSHDKPLKAQANAKRTHVPKPQEPAKPKEESKAPVAKTRKPAEKWAAGAEPVPEVAPKKRVEKERDDKPKPEANSKKSSEEKEASVLKKEEEKRDEKDEKYEEIKEKGKQEGIERSDEDGGVAAEDQRKGKKESVKLHNGGGDGIMRQSEGCKQAVDAMVRELRIKGMRLVLCVVIFVIFYVSLTKKKIVDGDGEL